MSESVRPEGCVYKLISLLGEGLTSRVYAAVREDSRGFSRQRVVLKILKTETDVPWLKREFGVLSKIRSPHCVSILGWENFLEGPALVLEHIDGVSLAELASAHILSAVEVDEITFQIQEGLRSLHDLEISHGDLSPSNIMIDREGIVRLIDFAIGSTENGQLVGTPTYMAPETWSGHPLSRGSDIFALGLIRYDLFNDFAIRPIEPTTCRDRSLELARTGCSLLAEKPADRKFLSLTSNSETRPSLGARVAALLVEKDRLRAATKILHMENVKQMSALKPMPWVWEKALFVRMLVSYRSMVVAQAGYIWEFLRLVPRTSVSIIAFFLLGMSLFSPLSSAQQISVHLRSLASDDWSQIEIRTARWSLIEVDDEVRGYSPLVASHLAPGWHMLRWRMRHQQGVLMIHLRPGQSQLLNENDLIRLSQ